MLLDIFPMQQTQYRLSVASMAGSRSQCCRSRSTRHLCRWSGYVWGARAAASYLCTR